MNLFSLISENIESTKSQEATTTNLTTKHSVAVILAAAGNSSRYGGANLKKVFARLDGKAVWQHSADTLSTLSFIKQMILVIHPDDVELVKSKFGGAIAILGIDVVTGGNERWQSVQNGLAKLKPEIDFVAIHDAARPLISARDIESVCSKAFESGAAILGTPIYGTVKRVSNDNVVETTVPRERLYQAQTPQVFRKDWLQSAYQKIQGNPTDDAQVVEQANRPVHIVKGSSSNIKITTQEDMKFAENFLANQKSIFTKTRR